MPKITYLFGAGASCGAMPLVSNLPQKMKAMREYLSLETNQLSNTECFIHTNNKYKTKLDFQKGFIKDLEALELASASHYTIDTYAKKLFATGKTHELFQLKLVLSCYFTLEQMLISGKCDNRYDSFWASLIGSHYVHMPKNVRILTWNYDIQMELSFSQYCPKQSLDTAINALNIHINNNRKNDLKSRNTFSVFKLNGTANGLLNLNDISYSDTFISYDYSNGLNIASIEKVVKTYSAAMHFSDHYKLAPTLSFAWECPPAHNGNWTSFIKVIESEIIDTEILIVIGYSFPFFNRDVDRALIRSMSKLEKVYVQDIEPDNVISSFRSIREDWSGEFPKRVEAIKMNNQFFLPPEL